MKEASLCHEGAGESPKKARVARDIFFYIIFLLFLLAGASAEEREVVHLNHKECLLLAVTRMELNYNFKKLGQLFRQNLVRSDVSTPTFSNYAKFNLLGILY